MKIITRDDLRQILEDWQCGKLSAEEVHDWAESLYFPGAIDYDDWENDENSVTNEVLAALDMMDMKLIISSDVQTYLEFLQTPAGQFDKGYEKLDAALKSIDYRKRAKELKDDPLYGPYCRPLCWM